MLNKSIQETNKIAYNKSYIMIKKAKKEKEITGGEALYSLLKKIKLDENAIKINKNILRK